MRSTSGLPESWIDIAILRSSPRCSHPTPFGHSPCPSTSCSSPACSLSHRQWIETPAGAGTRQASTPRRQPPILLQPPASGIAGRRVSSRLADDNAPRQVAPPRMHGKLLLRPTFWCEVGGDGRRGAGRTIRGAAGRRVPGMPLAWWQRWWRCQHLQQTIAGPDPLQDGIHGVARHTQEEVAPSRIVECRQPSIRVNSSSDRMQK
jgi:hypothetical protein